MSYLTWLREPQNRSTLIVLGTATAGLIMWGVWSFSAETEQVEEEKKKQKARRKRGLSKTARGKGYLLCPSDVGKMVPDTAGLVRGDFIIIQLSTNDDAFREPTWARVLSISPTGQELYIQIQGEYLPQGIKPIETSKHGYALDDRMVIPRECVFDVLHIESRLKGRVACGPTILDYKGADGSPIYKLKDTSGVEPGDLVEVVVGDFEGAWHEPIWVLVSTISMTKQILTGVVAEEPSMTGRHGLRLYSKLSFGRDCVVDIAKPFLDDISSIIDVHDVAGPLIGDIEE